MFCGLLAACGTTERERLAERRPLTPEGERVRAAFEQWPEASDKVTGIRRTFFTTIHAAGHRTTAVGVLRYYGPRDLRMTAMTEMGAVLFDVRVNWAGVTVLRTMPGLEPSVVGDLVKDLSAAFTPPPLLGALDSGHDPWVLRRTDANEYKYKYTFSPADGRLKQQEVSIGVFDTLTIMYRGYSGKGWPQELYISRPARLYTIAISFTEEPLAHQ